ncbi:MAG TPA: PAS domain S-box protein [Pyrinomonadaceae bacterium]
MQKTSDPTSRLSASGVDNRTQPDFLLRRKSWLVQLLAIVLVALAYFGAAKLGLSFASIHSSVSPIWPPTGIAIAAILLLGPRVWPGIFLGALLANSSAPAAIPAAIGIALGNTLEALLAHLVLQRLSFDISMERARDVFKFVVAATTCTTVSATIGTLSLCLGGLAPWDQFGSLWVTWWLGDLAGAATVTPFFLTWFSRHGLRLEGLRSVETALMAVLLTLSSLATFGVSTPSRLQYYPLARLMIPFLLWASFRLGHRGVTLAVLLQSASAVWGTMKEGAGLPFSAGTPNDTLIMLQLFISTNAVTFLFLAAVIEERRKAEKSLQAREAELQLITDATPVMLTRCSRDLRYVFTNRAYAQMLGHEPEDIIGKPIVDIIGDDALKTIGPYIERVLQGEQVEYEEEVTFKGVGSRFLRAAYRPDRDVTGKPVGWIASITDITERRRTQLRADKAVRQLALIVENTDDAIIGRDLNGIVTSWNAAAERLYGYRADEMIGKRLTVLIPADRHDEEPEILERLRGGKSIDHYATVRRAKDGRLIQVSLTASPIKDADGNVIGYSKIARDITERMQAEAEREALLKSEHEARGQAEEANRVKDEFLAVLSHELRTPLNAILGWASLLRSGKLDEANAERALEIVERNAKAQSNLIEGVLDVSRIVSGKLQLDVRPMHLSGVIEAAVDSIRPAADAKNMNLRVVINKPEPLVSGDATRLQQVVLNLLSNAVKFSPAGSEIGVRLDIVDSEVEIAVKDSGQGISSEFLPHVFDRFRQADPSTTRKHGGLGLGLAIVKHLVDLHGGSVRAESDGVGTGATFKVRLKKMEKAEGISTAPAPESRDTLEGKLTLEGLRVLVVDDHEDGREVLREMLSMCDAEVKAAGSASEALILVRDWHPEVVVSDISMPGVDGYAFISQLREQEGDRQIPAIAVTAHALAEDRERALAAGFQNHLAKPVKLPELIRSIVQVIGREKASNNSAN